jgi:hypothetical protein
MNSQCSTLHITAFRMFISFFFERSGATSRPSRRSCYILASTLATRFDFSRVPLCGVRFTRHF